MKFAVTVESVFVEWSVDGCLLTFCFFLTMLGA